MESSNNAANNDSDDYSSSDGKFGFISGICLEIFGLCGFVTNFVFLLALIKCKEIKKEPAIILVMNLVLTNMGQLFLVFSHVGIEEMVSSIDWGFYEPFVNYAMTTFWYSCLLTIFSTSLTRYFAVMNFGHSRQNFTFSHTIAVLFSQWLVSILGAILPLFNILCCNDIFDIQQSSEYRQENVNILKRFVFLLNFLLFAWLIYAYTSIILKLRKQANQVFVHVEAVSRQARSFRVTLQNQQNPTNSPSEMKRQKNLRISFQLIIVSVSYMCLVSSWVSLEVMGRTNFIVSLERLAFCVDNTIVSLTFFVFNADLRSVLRKMFCNA